MAFLKPAIGDKFVIKLKYDEPKPKEGKFGMQYFYGVEAWTPDGAALEAPDEYGWTWAASEAAHKVMQYAEAKQGTVLKIWRKAEKEYRYYLRVGKDWEELGDPPSGYNPDQTAPSSHGGKDPDAAPIHAPKGWEPAIFDALNIAHLAAQAVRKAFEWELTPEQETSVFIQASRLSPDQRRKEISYLKIMAGNEPEPEEPHLDSSGDDDLPF